MTLLLMILALLKSQAVACIVDHCQLVVLLLHLLPQRTQTTAWELSLAVLVTANVFHLDKSVTSTWIVLMARMKDLVVSYTQGNISYFVLWFKFIFGSKFFSPILFLFSFVSY